jgi:hypothetical protein
VANEPGGHLQAADPYVDHGAPTEIRSMSRISARWDTAETISFSAQFGPRMNLHETGPSSESAGGPAGSFKKSPPRQRRAILRYDTKATTLCVLE